MMKKLFIIVQWLVVLLLAGFAAWVSLKPSPQPAYHPDEWHSWNGFMAISYAGIGRHTSERYPSPAKLAEHMRALSENGYQPIRPEDAAAFLAGRAPLPERAVLVLFEGGRKDSLIRATPILQKTGFIGTMAVPTRYLKQWGSAYLKTPDLRTASKLPQWAFASMGHDAIVEIPVGGAGSKGRFLAQRKWAKGTVETADAFAKRITEDYYLSIDLLSDATRQPVITYLYPYGDPGTGPGSDPEAAQINLDAVSARFSIAFTRADDPFNGPSSDPFSLSRLRVSGNWTGSQLVKELKQFEPRSDAVAGFSDASRWFLRKGSGLKDNALILSDESLAWLRGSEGWTDIECTARIKTEPGAMVAVYIRYAAPSSYLRVTLDESVLRVQERLLNRMLGLASVPVPPASAGHELRVRVRGNRAWIWLDGNAAAGPLPLSPDTDRGRVGFGAHGGRAYVASFSVSPSPSYHVFADSYAEIPERRRGEVGAILPTWFGTDRPPAVTASQRGDALTAAAAGVECIPVIANPSDLPPEESERLATGIAEALAHPALKSLVTQLALSGISDHLSRALRARGFRLLHRLDGDQVRDVCRREGLREAPYDRLLIDAGPDTAPGLLDELLHVCPARRVLVRRDAVKDVPLGVRVVVRAEDFKESN
ncbi:MAG: Poly-beta-1,6-N-acetyl-D-glucosamine N-deacetylase precursor [Verrucomicrobia bacterium ADurb.Bin345]|nr:MAG: Poly-beta-1,6-N-acetyl-D-glucosamine N-deacetylase precursor [Verrucomicrobia bacterium ADurb.Bin345]